MPINFTSARLYKNLKNKTKKTPLIYQAWKKIEIEQ